MSDYWAPSDFKLLNKAKSFEDIGKVALRVQNRMPIPISQVCGPISTGGKDSIKKNIKVFENTIKKLKTQGYIVYNQLPLEESIVKIKESLGDKFDVLELLNEVYLPLFKSKKIETLHFIYGWQSSFGSTWEHQTAKKLNININYLPHYYLLT